MAIIFMSLTFLMIIALVTAVYVIRSKINKIHDTIDQRINSLTGWAEKGGELTAMATSKVKQAKKVLKKARK
jgi:hypothetical protein